MTYRIPRKLAYLLKARHRGGHGIHSPFLFRLITEVLENRGNFSAYPLLRAAEENVTQLLKILDMEGYRREGEEMFGFSRRTIQKLHLLPGRFDRLIFRLVNDFQPGGVAFYGSTFGVTLLALALADRRITLGAQVENDHYRSFCRRLIEVYEVDNVRLTGAGEVTAADFVVVQHPLDPDYCKQVLDTVLSEPAYCGTVVLCGIHTSSRMETVWERSKDKPAVRVSLDLFEVGVLICKNGLQKERFVVRF